MAASRAGGEDEGRVRVTLTQLSSRLDESRRELNRLLIDLAEGGRYNLSWCASERAELDECLEKTREGGMKSPPL